MKTANTLWRLAGGLSLGVAVVAAGALVAPAAAAVSAEASALALDKLVLRNGKIIEGEILSENSTEVRFNVIVAGISAPATFKKSQIIEIIRGDADPAPDADDRADSPIGEDTKSEAPLISASTDAPRVCVINLKGEFGKAISPTPVREAVQAARKEEPDFLIVHLDTQWIIDNHIGQDYEQEVFDVFFVAQKLEPIFTKEIDREWEKVPHVVFWVGNAMGGAAFLPFMADEIYMEPDGRIGGIGTLEQMFEGRGDEIVRQKQRSLRLARAQGLAIANGYDYRLINALAQRSYVLSFNVDSGEMFERMPESTNEKLLTDDGKDDRIDSMNQLVRGTGNDVLTIKADIARQLGLSSGTASDLNELLELLGILRNHVMIEGKSDRILETWAKNVADAQARVRSLYREFNEVQVGGTPADARRALSTRKSILKRIQGLFRMYGESFDPFGEGIGNITNLETQIEEIDIQILLLRD